MAFLSLASTRSRLTALLVVTVLVVFGHYSHLLRPLENLLLLAAQPFQTRLYGLTAAAVAATELATEPELTHEQLREENQALRDEVQNLQIENAHLKTLASETSLLEEQLTFLRDRSYPAVNARVTSRTTEQLSQSLVINRGQADGIRVGDAVIVGDGVLVGTIAQVADHSSQVLLLTSFNSRVGGTVQNDAASPGVVLGEHNISLRIDYLPQLDAVEVGAAVVTSGSEGRVPGGLLIGSITAVEQHPGSLFQSATLQPFYQATKLTILSVITQ
jgi:rod shape-determining protein MreC